MSSVFYPEGSRVDVLVSFPEDGPETQWYEPGETAALEEHSATLAAQGIPHAAVGFDFTPFAQDYGWGYDADGEPLPEREAELREEIGDTAGHIVDDAIETRWGDIIEDARTQIAMGV